MDRSFSDRHGYSGAEPDISIREDAPDFLRFQVASIAEKCDLRPGEIRSIVCNVLLEVPDSRNWSEYPNIWDEVLGLLQHWIGIKFMTSPKLSGGLSTADLISKLDLETN